MTKRFAPAAERNTPALLDVLRPRVPATGRLLEISSGTGQHALAFATAFPGLEVQPSEPDPSGRASIEAYRAEASCPNLRPPLDLDVTARPWPIDRADVIVNCNMIHISPWTTTLGLFAGAGEVLTPGGWLLLYGPFLVDGAPTTPSNQAFDVSLRQRDPAWGLRDRDVVTEVAAGAGLVREAVLEMPANNFSLIFSKPA